MGVKGLLRVLDPFLLTRIEPLDKKGVVHVDFSSIIHNISHCELKPYDAKDVEKADKILKNTNCVVKNGLYVDIKKLCAKLNFLINQLPYTQYDVLFCMDGDKRPMMKQTELAKRSKYTSPQSTFIKMIINQHGEEIVHRIKTAPHPSKVKSVAMRKSEHEADALVAKGTLAMTTDSDIFLLSLYNANMDYIAFCRKGQLHYLDMSVVKHISNRRFIYFSCIAGNDYLPNIYNPTSYEALLDNMTDNFCECYKNIYAKLRPRDVKYTTHEEVEPHVRVWLLNIKAYIQYLMSGDSMYLDTFNEDFQITKCLPSCVYSVLQILSEGVLK